jgi:redox-sensitive bicupin YhaK (pirin superfamily)
LIRAKAASDGAGVRLLRSLGQSPDARLDPFLMLDEFATDDPNDYIAGFPSHPHRGFETVTYMLEGRMLHEDHLGNRGLLDSGGAQWMTAGRGIIHSEMPQQTEGRMHGFQLWINLPGREKMKPASYRDLGAEEIPTARWPDGAHARVLAGRLVTPDGTVSGPIEGVTTQPLFLDVEIPAGAEWQLPVAAAHSAFLYVYQGSVATGPQDAECTVNIHEAGVLGRAGQADGADDVLTLRVTSTSGGRFLLLSARPLGEPVVQYGPFVMNRREEIEQALADYRDGRLA